MTLDTWMAHFAAGAAQLPGWRRTHLGVRRFDAAAQRWFCPLMAQWHLEHPQDPCVDPWDIRGRWSPMLDRAVMNVIMDAADDVADDAEFFPPSEDRVRLQHLFLALCLVAEEDV